MLLRNHHLVHPTCLSEHTQQRFCFSRQIGVIVAGSTWGDNNVYSNRTAHGTVS